MLRFLADEDLNNRIVRGLLRRNPAVDIIRVQDTHLGGAADQTVLDWADQNNRVLLTHDVSTMTKHAFARVRSGLSIAGIIEVPQSLPVGQAIDDLMLYAMACTPDEMVNRVEYLPL